MTMNNNNFFRLIFNKFTNFLDFVLLILSIVYLMISLSNIIIYLIDIIFNSTYIPVFNMSDVTTTNVQISRDSTIADGIRTLLIYGFGLKILQQKKIYFFLLLYFSAQGPYNREAVKCIFFC